MIKTSRNRNSKNKQNDRNDWIVMGCYLGLMLFVLTAILVFIHFENIRFEKYIDDQTGINNKKLLMSNNHTVTAKISSSMTATNDQTSNISPSLTTMPFHIDKDDIIIICIDHEPIYFGRLNGRIVTHLMIDIIHQQFWINNSSDLVTMSQVGFKPHQLHFNNIEDTFEYCKDYKTCRNYKVNNIIIRNMNINSTRPFPIKSALQQLEVLLHQETFFKNASMLAVHRIQDAMTLAAISMLSYADDVMKEARKRAVNNETLLQFYGGEIFNVNEFNVKMPTGLSPDQIIQVGTIRVWSWKYKDIFVISFRGTVPPDNWSINFKCKAMQIKFNGNGDYQIHSGIYGIVNKYFNDIMKIFDNYDNEKRIILTGHSLGSALAQTTLLHLLEKMNKNKVERILYNDKIAPFLEIITFGGPAIMSQRLTVSLKQALENFNGRHNRAVMQHPIIFTKEKDAVTFTGSESYHFWHSVFHDEHFLQYFYRVTTEAYKHRYKALTSLQELRKFLFKKGVHSSGSKAYLNMRINGAPKAQELGEQGVADMTIYQHFGEEISVASSKYNLNPTAGWIELDIINHAEYLEAHVDSFGETAFETILMGWQ